MWNPNDKLCSPSEENYEQKTFLIKKLKSVETDFAGTVNFGAFNKTAWASQFVSKTIYRSFVGSYLDFVLLTSHL